MENTVREVTTDDGVTISYTVFDGEEPAVMILHGLAGSSCEFLPTACALNGRKVVLIDQRGHGRSSRLPSDTSRQAFIDDVVRVIEAEELGVVDLVGQSMGAHTAMLVAASHPDLVRRLVLLECYVGEGTAEDHTGMGDYFRSWEVPFPTRESAQIALGDTPLARAWVSDLEERHDGFYPRFDPDVMVRIIADVMSARWEEWGSIRIPTLVIFAEHGMFSDEQKNLFTERGANVLRVDLAGGSHDAHLDAFEQWIDALTSFIAAR